MSEVFDPEKVQRFDSATIGKDGWVDGVTPAVAASDYDKLLALYRELRDRPYSTWPQGG